jgi:hypothetical protein
MENDMPEGTHTPAQRAMAGISVAKTVLGG